MVWQVAVASALVSAYGSYKSGKAQASAQREQAQLNFLRAEEVMARNEMNNEALHESALVHRGSQVSKGFGSGRTMQSTAVLRRETMRRAAKQIEMNTRAAEWEARMVRLGAESSNKSAGQIESANKVSTAGNLGLNLTNIYRAKKD